MLLALDPGLNSPGAALFGLDGLLGTARVNIPANYAALPDGQRWLQIARAIVAWTRAVSTYPPDVLVFERPQVYTRDKSVGDPNHLVAIAGVAACVVGHYSDLIHLRVSSPHPGEWVGQLSKKCHVCKKNLKKCPECKGSAWNTQRGRRIRSRLTPAELARVPDQNDAIDAVGLGLFELGRLAPRQVFSNGRD